MPRHFTYTQEAFDKIARIVCKEKQKEIDELKKYIESLGREGRGLAAQYMFDEHFPHEVYDFLMAL